jgi:hypothetical protein
MENHFFDLILRLCSSSSVVIYVSIWNPIGFFVLILATVWVLCDIVFLLRQQPVRSVFFTRQGYLIFTLLTSNWSPSRREDSVLTAFLRRSPRQSCFARFSFLLPHAASFVLQSLTCSEVSLSCSFLCAAWKDSSPCPACTRFISPPSLGLDFGLSVPSAFHRCVLLWSKFRSWYLNQGSASQSPRLSLSLLFC